MAVIKVENLSKQYRLGYVNSETLQDDLRVWWANIRGKENPLLKVGDTNDRTQKGDSDYVWSLRDINFEVQQGEVLGIIGRNGAGKSTLLKILSKVTGPTTGSVKIKGRVASLLEVGTGFNPQLSGRENIFLNGAILGMKKSEIQQKFDEIVAFSGVEKYIDTPVKRYSSGMYVRLAFAVAAHLEPEILIVDEVLAVGDAEFQKKCLGKMKDVSGQGRTVLFVSHNMAAVKSLCSTAIILENGIKIFDGDTTEAVSVYLKGNTDAQHHKIFIDKRYRSHLFHLHEIYLKNTKKAITDSITEDDDIELITKISLFDKRVDRYHMTYHVVNESGEPLFSISNASMENEAASLSEGENIIRCKFPKMFFQPGTFYLSLYIVEDRKRAVFVEKDIISFTVSNAARDLGVYMGREPGFIRPNFEWENLSR
jgi:lipopolysaccharide transport system ATP-binding protein